MIMTSMTLDLPRRFPWPTLLSVCIHGAVVAGLLYTSGPHGFLFTCPSAPPYFSTGAPAAPFPPQARPPTPQPGGAAGTETPPHPPP
ncbi:TonB system transport protein TonB, partial [Escherichia coli]